MEATKSWLSLGKLRVGWGILGNNRIDELSRYTYLVNGYNYPYGMGNHQLQPGITALTIGNPDIKWEKTETFNVGLDLSFFQNSLTMGVEYFNKKTSDMLLTVPTVPSAGLSSDPMTSAASENSASTLASISRGSRMRLQASAQATSLSGVPTSARAAS